MDESLKSHFFNLYQIMLADEVVDPRELAMLYKIGKERGVSDEEMNKILFSPIELTPPNTLDMKIEYLCDITRMILADDKIEMSEIEIFKVFCQKFGFLEENIDKIYNTIMEKVKSGLSTTEIINQIKEV